MGEPRTLEPLTVEECYELLEGQPVGRVAISWPAQPPFVSPVTFVLDGVCPVFQTDVGEKLAAVGRRVSFEVDSIDTVHRTGWSVLVQGTLWLDGLVGHAGLEPWVGDPPFTLRIVPDLVTGRRLSLRLPDTDERGYR